MDCQQLPSRFLSGKPGSTRSGAANRTGFELCPPSGSWRFLGKSPGDGNPDDKGVSACLVVYPLSWISPRPRTAAVMGKSGSAVVAKNRKAFFSYEIDDRIECGIELKGTEVKSIRGGRLSFSDAYVRIIDNELWMIGFHIAEYDHGNLNNHEPLRRRRLLAHKQEIKRLKRKTEERGFTLVPLAVHLKNGLIKIDVGLGRGKKTADKREAIKKRDLQRDAQREMRSYS